MSDTVEWFLVTLAVVLGGAAFAVGAEVIRATWRDAWPAPQHGGPLPPDGDAPPGARQAEHASIETGVRPKQAPAMLRSIAAFEAFKGVAALAAAFGLLALVSHPLLVDSISAIVGHLGLAPGETLAIITFDHWLAAERGPLMLGAAGYATLHLVEAWGLWHMRVWGEALGVASGAVYLPFELSHLLHKPGLPAAALVVLNMAVVVFLVWRLRPRQTR